MAHLISFFLFILLWPAAAEAHGGFSFDPAEWLGMMAAGVGPGLLLSLPFMKGDAAARLAAVGVAALIAVPLSLLVTFALFMLGVAGLAGTNLLIALIAVRVNRGKKGAGSALQVAGKTIACLAIGVVLVVGAQKLAEVISANKAFNETLTQAESGNPAAQRNVAEQYLKEGRKAEAEAYLRKAAEKNAYGADLQLAQLYAEGVAPPDGKSAGAEAVAWYTKAADRGEVRATYELGELYRTGKGVAKDGARALEWYEKTAAMPVKYFHGYDVQALLAAASIYETGDGVPKDMAKAYLYCLQAEFRSGAPFPGAAARDRLAAKLTPDEKTAAEEKINEMTAGSAAPRASMPYYTQAEGVYYQGYNGANARAAAALFRLSAERGNAEAGNYLGNIYTRGEGGVTQDFKEACYWFALSVKRYTDAGSDGYAQRSQDNSRECASHLDDAARAEIDSRVAAFKPLTRPATAAELEAISTPQTPVIENDPLAYPAR